MTVEMILRIITKNHAADPEIRFLTKSFSKPNDCATTSRELIFAIFSKKQKNLK